MYRSNNIYSIGWLVVDCEELYICIVNSNKNGVRKFIKKIEKTLASYICCQLVYSTIISMVQEKNAKNAYQQ